MSSFLDRWLYRSPTTHNGGNKLQNTGSKYNRDTTLTSSGQYTNYYTPADGNERGEKTTPNLRNVPWAYYRECKTGNAAIITEENLKDKQQRRGSSSSDSSVESNTY